MLPRAKTGMGRRNKTGQNETTERGLEYKREVERGRDMGRGK